MPVRMKDLEASLRHGGNHSPLLVSAALLSSDMLALALAFLCAYFMRRALVPLMGGYVSRTQMQPLAIMLAVFVPTVFLFSGLYPGHGRAGFIEFRKLVLAISLAYVAAGVASFVLGYGFQFSRLVFLFGWGLTAALVVVFRTVVRRRGNSFRWWSLPAVVVGIADDVGVVLNYLLVTRRLGFAPVAALVFGRKPGQPTIRGIPVFRFSSDLLPVLRASGVQLAVVASPSSDLDRGSRRQVHNLSSIFPRVVRVADDPALNVVHVNEMLLLGRPTFEIQNKLLSGPRQAVKRISDLLFCLIGAGLGLPVFVALSLLIALDSRGHVLYRQKRVGLNGRLFDLYKFRTMQEGAEEALDALLGKDPLRRREYEMRHKLKADPRVTRVGRFLRRFSLDEYPQFWNVIRGDMSVVGPRPYMPSELENVGAARSVVLKARPGLTGWWQVMGRHKLAFQERLRMDEFYVGNYSMLTDAYIMLKTVYVVVSGEGM